MGSLSALDTRLLHRGIDHFHEGRYFGFLCHYFHQTLWPGISLNNHLIFAHDSMLERHPKEQKFGCHDERCLSLLSHQQPHSLCHI